MGGIYFGIFTPSEAGGIGAFGAFLFVLLKGKLNWEVLIDSLKETGKTTAMIFLIIIGANIFSSFLGLTKIPMLLASTVAGLQVPRMIILIGIIIIYLILGCIMDAYAIMILTVPILFPVIKALGFDPIWFGVIMVMVLEVGLITPPVGLNVYVIHGAAKDVKMNTIFQGIVPFLILDIIAITIIILFPKIATFLPEFMMR
jgi:tripartite ATP-independent transporter DctM subunit